MTSQSKLWLPYAWQAQQQARVATQIQPSDRAQDARNNLGIFGEHISGYQPAAHHQEWLDAIVTNQDSTALKKVAGKNLRIAAPRGAAKTTWISLALAWIIGHNPGIRVILVSFSEEIALSISVAVKLLIESEAYREVFPSIMPSKRWSDGAWFIDRAFAGFTQILKDPTVLAVGSGGSIVSRRSDLIVLEDPIKSSDAIANPIIRTGMVKWWGEVLRPTMVPGGRALTSCTRYRIDDIHGTTFTPENNWQVITQRAIIERDGAEQSYWHEYITLKELQQIREENPVTFASQYQNEPLSEENQIIKPEWITRGRAPQHFEAIAIGIDLAASKKETADYTALVVCGRQGKVYYVLDLRRGRWTIYETAVEIFKLLDEWGHYTLNLTLQIESVAYQSAFGPELKRLALEAGLSIRCEDVKPKGDKEQRLRGISGLLESGYVIFNELAALGILIEELLQFGMSAHDDCADAFVYALAKLFKARKPLSGGHY